MLAALAALLRSERQLGIRTAWAVALVALVFAVLSNRSAWAGPATLVYGIALLSAATLGADGARSRVAEQKLRLAPARRRPDRPSPRPSAR